MKTITESLQSVTAGTRQSSKGILVMTPQGLKMITTRPQAPVQRQKSIRAVLKVTFKPASA